MKPHIFIHIGKSGGSTVKKTFPTWKCVHLRKVKFSSESTYSMVLRNPIDRFISAFYYRRDIYNQGKSHQPYIDYEKEIYTKYNDIHRFAEALPFLDKSTVSGIGNIKESIYYYLGDIIDKLDNSNVTHILCTHFLDEEILKIKPDYSRLVLKDNSKNRNKIPISPALLQNIEDFVQLDFNIIDELNRKGLLTPRQYHILSKRTGWV
jgi:hypothetical protein